MAESVQVTRINDWHQALADFILMYPQATGKQIAAHFDVSAQWVSIVRNSDSFKELMRQRRETHRELVSASVINKVEALADQAVDELARQIEAKELPVEHVKDIAAMSLKAMGFGGDRAAAPVQNNITIVADRAALAEAREKLIAQRNATVPVLEGAKQLIEERKEDGQRDE